ncbi:MAG: nucleotidyltransferase [Pyramidobacter sp.]|nr:nucleotidyltransferase [Pyramidobacter sp.]
MLSDDQRNYYDTLLSNIADELNISQTMMEKAILSYEAVGKWLGDGIDYEVKIEPQGSMNLGTVVRPLSEADSDYDLDLICLLKDGQNLRAFDIKKLVGDRLRAHAEYRKKLDKEGKRCWTMDYDGFHMDILPCVPNDRIYGSPCSTKIRLTHKTGVYSYEDRFSDPHRYRLWFQSQMNKRPFVIIQDSKYKAQTEIDSVPIYNKRSVLQKAIQIMKRHRDKYFADDLGNRPISIIITTLAAIAFNGETSLYNALCGIIERMPNYIHTAYGRYYIYNPVAQEENFAEKWNLKPEKAEAFYTWLSRIQYDIITFLGKKDMALGNALIMV